MLHVFLTGRRLQEHGTLLPHTTSKRHTKQLPRAFTRSGLSQLVGCT